MTDMWSQVLLGLQNETQSQKEQKKKKKKQRYTKGAGEVAEHLRALAAIAEDMGSISGPHTVAHGPL